MSTTGPFVYSKSTWGPKNRFGASAQVSNITRTWYRQSKPWTAPLRFSSASYKVTLMLNPHEFTYPYSSIPDTNISNETQRCYNAAYASFMSEVKADTSELLTTFVEWKKSRDMIYDRATKLYMGFIAAKRGDVRTLKRLWGKGAGVRRNLRKQGSNVLEYSFGWAPLVSDISSSVAVLSKGIPASYISKTKKFRYKFQWSEKTSYSVETTQIDVTIGWCLRAWIRVTNPNLLLAQQLGLVNPVSVLWEITPWSFVLDYFVNVSDFISSFSDLLGMELIHPSRTSRIISNGSMISRNTTKENYVLPGFAGTIHRIERYPGIPGPTLSLRPPWRLSFSRAATSVALLVQQIKG